MRKRKCSRGEASMAVICVAFGAGIILALFCSLKLVVILAAVFLVVLGLSSMKC